MSTFTNTLTYLRWGLSSPLADTRGLDLSVRLFQNVIQSFLLREIDPATAARVQSAGERDWFGGVAVLTGIPAAAGIDVRPSATHAPAPFLRFDPTPKGLEELYLAHRALRLARLAGGLEDTLANARALMVLAAIGAGLRRAGLSGAYIAAARRARAALPHEVTLTDVGEA